MVDMASQITSLTIVYPTVYPGADQRKHQTSASLAFPSTQRANNAENVSIWWRHHDRASLLYPFQQAQRKSSNMYKMLHHLVNRDRFIQLGYSCQDTDWSVIASKHIEAWTNWPPFSRRQFQIDFLECKRCMNFDFNFTSVLFQAYCRGYEYSYIIVL